MDTQELLVTAGRTVAVYALMLVVLRCLGKREVGSFTPFDLLVALMLGEVVDEIAYGDVTFAQGATVILVVALLQYVTGWLTYLSRSMDRLLEGVPAILIHNGELNRPAMRKERVNEQEVMALLRQQGVDDLREVKLATLEVSGHMTVLKQDWAEPVRKGDLDGPERQQKQADTGGQEEPPPDKQTGAPRALGHEVTA
jgi:uncharacterized membrane protein YcaP (DUF421 family)